MITLLAFAVGYLLGDRRHLHREFRRLETFVVRRRLRAWADRERIRQLDESDFPLYGGMSQ